MKFTLLRRKKKLVISAPTSFAVNGVSKNIIHTALEASNRAKKNY